MTVEYYQSIYQTVGSQGSALTVIPFNQGSKQDVEALVTYIYMTLRMDLDYILPFATITENGCEIDGLDNKSKLAHHIMLVNLLHILGTVKGKKAIRQFITHLTQVILLLSHNHGLFGKDGLDSVKDFFRDPLQLLELRELGRISLSCWCCHQVCPNCQISLHFVLTTLLAGLAVQASWMLQMWLLMS